MDNGTDIDGFSICKIDCLKAINEGTCHADCCRVVSIPFLSYFYESTAQYRFCEPDDIIELGRIVYPFRKDTICVYLDQNTNICKIYHLRPQICANYGTRYGCLRYKNDGSLLHRKERRNILRTHDSNMSVAVKFNQLKQIIKKDFNVKEFDTNSRDYQILLSCAMPITTLKMMKSKFPDLVKILDVDGLI